MKLLKITLTFIGIFACAISLQAQQTNPIPHQCKENWKWGFADSNGNIVIPCKYDKVREFSNGFAVVTDMCKPICPDCDFPAGFICKEGIIDKKGNLIVPLKYDQIEDFNNEGKAKVFKDKKIGYVDKSGKEIIPCIYTTTPFYLFVQISANGKIGLIDKKGNVLLPAHYENITMTKQLPHYYIKKPIIRIKLDGKYGFADSTAKVIVTPRYDYIEQETHSYVIVKNKDKFGLVDKITGKELVPCLYHDVTLIGNKEGFYHTLKNTYFQLMLNNKWGVADSRGKIIVPLEYDNIQFSDEGIQATKDGKSFLFNQQK